MGKYDNSTIHEKRDLLRRYKGALEVASYEFSSRILGKTHEEMETELIQYFGKTLEEVKKEAAAEECIERKQKTSERIANKLNDLIKLVEKDNEYLNNTTIQIDEKGYFDIVKTTKLTA